MMVMIRTPFVPGAVEWVSKQGDAKARLAVSDRNSSFVYIYDARAGSNEPIISKEVYWKLNFTYIWVIIYSYLNCFSCTCSLKIDSYFMLPKIHLGPVKVMKYNHLFDSVISADAKGIIEYWSPTTLQFPEDKYVSIIVTLYPFGTTLLIAKPISHLLLKHWLCLVPILGCPLRVENVFFTCPHWVSLG